MNLPFHIINRVVNMKFLYKGYQVHYEYEGNGPTLIMLHGWGVNSSTFSSIFNRLKDDYKILRFDFIGFGESSMPVIPFHLDDYVDMLRSLIVYLGIDDFMILGHSFGGRVAIVYASMYKVRQLILVSSAGLVHFSIKTKFKIFKYKALKRLYKLTSKKRLEKLQSKSGSKDYKDASPVMKKTMSNIIKRDLKKEIRVLDVSTLILWGYSDKSTPYKDALLMHKLIKGSKLITFYNSRHFCYIEEEDKFVNVLKKEGRKNE